MSRPAVSTWCRADDEGPLDFVRRVADRGASGLALHAGLPAAWLAELPAALAGAELPVVAVEAPCPRGKARSVPFLASADKDERREAVAQCRAAVDLAAGVGARTVIVRLGRLATRDGWPVTVRRFRRGSLDDDERNGQNREHMLLAPRALDQARFGLDPLLAHAGGRGVQIALCNRARWYEVPDEIDLGVLRADFSGSPLVSWFDPAAAEARARLGHGNFTSALASFAVAAVGAWLSDAAGLQGGLPWGQGEVDREAVTQALPVGALRVVHAAPTMRDDELEAAIRRGENQAVLSPAERLHRLLARLNLATTPRGEDLPRVFELYRSVERDDRVVLADLLLAMLNTELSAGQPSPLQGAVLDTLFAHQAEHPDELARWMDTRNPDPNSWWPITRVLLRHAEEQGRP